MLPSYVFETWFKIDKKFYAKGIQNNGILNHTANKYWENKAFLTSLILRFIFVKTVSIARKYKIPPEVFEIKFLYLVLIKVFAIL